VGDLWVTCGVRPQGLCFRVRACEELLAAHEKTKGTPSQAPRSANLPPLCALRRARPARPPRSCDGIECLHAQTSRDARRAPPPRPTSLRGSPNRVAARDPELPPGLCDALVDAAHAVRGVVLLDNSGSMGASDGSRLVTDGAGRRRQIRATR
jgi:hypothetical protein